MAYTTAGFRPMRSQLRLDGGVDSQTAGLTLDGKSGNLQSIDPEGTPSIFVTLPSEDSSKGLLFWIRNIGTGDGVITVRDDGLNTIVQLLNGDSTVVACDGTSWLAFIVAKPTPGLNQRTLTGNLVLPGDAYEYQQIDPGGSNRTITLPSAAANKNRTFFFSNFADGAEDLDIGGVVTINQNEAVRIVSNGVTWDQMGVITIALT